MAAILIYLDIIPIKDYRKKENPYETTTGEMGEWFKPAVC